MNNYKAIRSSNLFVKGEPFNFSRSKVESFIKCPRCFYIDRVHGTGHPPGYPFNLNSAVDTLLKREFDMYRELQISHPLILENGYDFVPFSHDELKIWRENFKGVQTEYKGYSFSGAVDDVWVNKEGQLVIVDYKATAAKEPIRTIDKDYHEGYKRQMEFYQWLFRKNGFEVSDMGMFVYCTGDNTLDSFDASIKFSINLIPYVGSDTWVEETLGNLIICAESDDIPESGAECEMCKYYKQRSEFEITASNPKELC